MRARWLLVWAAFSSFLYPLVAFLVRVIKPGPSMMPDWMCALILAFGYTYLVWSARNQRREDLQANRRPRRPLLSPLRLTVLVFVAGVGSHFWLGRPTWPEVAGYSLVCGGSLIVSDRLFLASGWHRLPERVVE